MKTDGADSTLPWLPAELRLRLAPYLSVDRTADPTDGFMLSCCNNNPAFMYEDWKDQTAASRRKILMDMLGVPKSSVTKKKRGVANNR